MRKGRQPLARKPGKDPSHLSYKVRFCPPTNARIILRSLVLKASQGLPLPTEAWATFHKVTHYLKDRRNNCSPIAVRRGRD